MIMSLILLLLTNVSHFLYCFVQQCWSNFGHK